MKGAAVGRGAVGRGRPCCRRGLRQGKAPVLHVVLLPSAVAGHEPARLPRRWVPDSTPAGVAAAKLAFKRDGLWRVVPQGGGTVAARADAVGRAPGESGESHPAVPLAVPEHEAQHRGGSREKKGKAHR